jgi:hypothetical protein
MLVRNFHFGSWMNFQIVQGYTYNSVRSGLHFRSLALHFVLRFASRGACQAAAGRL